MSLILRRLIFFLLLCALSALLFAFDSPKVRGVAHTATAVHALGGIAGIRLVLTVLARISCRNREGNGGILMAYYRRQPLMRLEANDLTVRTQALVGVAFVTLRQVHADAIVGARTGVACVDLLTMRSCKAAAALALVLLHAGIRVADSLAGTIGVLAAVIGFGGHLQAHTLRSPQLGHHCGTQRRPQKDKVGIKWGLVLIKATQGLVGKGAVKKVLNRPNGNHK